EHRRPRRADKVGDVSRRRERDEDKKSAAAAQAVGEPSARILVERVKAVLGGPEQPYRSGTGAERLHILWQELLAQLLAESEQENGCGCGRYVALDSQLVCKPRVIGFRRRWRLALSGIARHPISISIFEFTVCKSVGPYAFPRTRHPKFDLNLE